VVTIVWRPRGDDAPLERRDRLRHVLDGERLFFARKCGCEYRNAERAPMQLGSYAFCRTELAR
jgi:hypothetical protein